MPVHRFDGFVFNRRGNRNGDGHDVYVGRYFCRGLWLFRWYRSAAMVDHPSSRSALLYTIVIILILIGSVNWHDHRTDHRFDYAQPQIVQVESAATQKS